MMIISIVKLRLNGKNVILSLNPLIEFMSSSSVQNKTSVAEPGDEGSIAPISIKRGHERCHRFHVVLENFVLYVNCYHACVIFESSLSSCLYICVCLSTELDVLCTDTISQINSANQFDRIYAKAPSRNIFHFIYCIVFA